MSEPGPTAPAVPRASRGPVEDIPPINFFSIEIETPARSFWESLARLLSRLGAAARRKRESRR